jgi:hypothetical protein
MRVKALVVVSFISLSLIFGPTSPVLALRCHGSIVSEGDHKYDVLKKCGEPDLVETREEVYVEAYGLDFFGFGGLSADYQRLIKVVIEEWTYNFGPHRLIYHLIFVDGELRSISTRGHGYPE